MPADLTPEKALDEIRALHAPVWSNEFPPGGRVCSECGVPVESEPCHTVAILARVTPSETVLTWRDIETPVNAGLTYEQMLAARTYLAELALCASDAWADGDTANYVARWLRDDDYPIRADGKVIGIVTPTAVPGAGEVERPRVGDTVRLTGTAWPQDLKQTEWAISQIDPDGTPAFEDSDGEWWEVRDSEGDDDYSVTIVARAAITALHDREVGGE